MEVLHHKVGSAWVPLVMAQTLSRAANDLKQAVNLHANMTKSFVLNLQVCKMNQKQITQEEMLQIEKNQSVCILPLSKY